MDAQEHVVHGEHRRIGSSLCDGTVTALRQYCRCVTQIADVYFSRFTVAVQTRIGISSWHRRGGTRSLFGRADRRTELGLI